MLTKYQAKEFLLKNADENFCRNFYEEKLINLVFFEFKRGDKKSKKIRVVQEESGQKFQSVTKILKKMIICI